jgi:hypothetical protein
MIDGTVCSVQKQDSLARERCRCDNGFGVYEVWLATAPFRGSCAMNGNCVNIDRAGTIVGCSFLVMSAVLMLKEGGLIRNAVAGWYREWHSARMIDENWAEIASAGTTIGQGSAEVLVEFTDYTCPYCKVAHDSSLRLLRDNQDRKLVVRFFPKPGSALARAAAVAGLCAGNQGRFAEFTAEMFRADSWMQTQDWETVAREAGVADTAAFALCLTSDATLGRLAQDSVLGVTIGVVGTPAFVGRTAGLRIGVVPNEERAGWFTPH